MIKRLVALVACLASLAVQAQAPLFEEIRTVSSVATPVQSAEFTVVNAGMHDITLTDLGATLTPAAPVTAIQLAVMRGPVIAGTMTAVGTTQVNSPPEPTSSGSRDSPAPMPVGPVFGIGARRGVRRSRYSASMMHFPRFPPLVPGHVRLIQDGVTLPAGSYVAELVDLAFPQALSFSSVIVTSGANAVALLDQPAMPGDNASFTIGSSGPVSIFALGDSPAATNAGTVHGPHPRHRQQCRQICQAVVSGQGDLAGQQTRHGGGFIYADRS